MPVSILKKSVILVGLSLGLFNPAFASSEEERVYLLQVLKQLEAVEINLKAAQQQQSPTARLQFHYTAYRDAAGQPHNGILDDLKLIRDGVQEKLSDTAPESHEFQPIEGDYSEDQEKMEDKEDKNRESTP